MLRWQRSGGVDGFAPVPPDIDEGLTAIVVGQRLGIPAHEVAALSPIWIRNALVSLKIEQMQHERAMKEAKRKAGKRKAAPRARRR